MPRVDRSRPSVRLRPSLSLERLEERQLLSIAPIHVATPQPLPQMTALSTRGLPPTDCATVPARSLFRADTKGLWPQSDHRPGSRRDDRPRRRLQPTEHQE